MNVITKPELRAAASHHAATKAWVEHWLTVVSKLQWSRFIDVREHYPSADLVGDCLVFNVLSNNYRLIVGVWWAREAPDGTLKGGALYFKYLLTHAEYDKGHWKDECNCR